MLMTGSDWYPHNKVIISRGDQMGAATEHEPEVDESGEHFFAKFATRAAEWSGSSFAFAASLIFVVLWTISGPYYGYSDTWQLIINTVTSIVTFLVVFLIQRAQSKDSHAIHLKLNELLAAMQGASNQLIASEALSEEEIKNLKRQYQLLRKIANSDANSTEAHTVEETKAR